MEKAFGVNNLPIDYIIGLTRGGLFPALILSLLYDIPMIAVNYSSTGGRGDNRNHQNALPSVSAGVVSGTGKLPDLPRLLVVDDICDSGHTMKEVSDFYLNQGHQVLTATLHYKSGAVLTPDFYWQKIEEDSPWIIYPWENNDR
jgi:hypoxanthine phosphoribosyltransferase